MEKIKIFVSYKTKHPILKNEIIIPIQTGRAIAEEIFDGMIGDDTGENISKENERYNELSAQYWVWKHYEEIGNPEYVGFMHYRRQFIFDNELKHLPITWLPDSEIYYVDEIYDGYMNHFTPQKIYPHLEDAPDFITFKKCDFRPQSEQYATNMKTYFSHMLKEQREEFYTVFENVFEEKYPNYNDTVKNFTQNTKTYVCNSFIMKKEMFFEYCEFLFGVLAEIDRRIDSTNFTKDELRFLGFLGEYLLTIFITQKLKEKEYNLKELPATFVSKNYKKLKRKLLKSMILSKLCFGKKKKYYIERVAKYKKYFK